MYDFILRQYNDPNYVLSMDFFLFLELVPVTQKKIWEERMWTKYCIDAMFMDQETYVPFDEYINPRKKRKSPTKQTAEEIKSGVRKILEGVKK